MPTINFIEYANYLYRLGLSEEITSMEQLSEVLHSDFLRTKLNNYLSTMHMMETEKDNRVQIIGNDKEYVNDMAKEIFNGLILGDIEKEDNNYLYNHYDVEESFEHYIHEALDYILKIKKDLAFALTFESLDSGVISFITLNEKNISIKNFIDTDVVTDLRPFEQYIYTLTTASINLYNTDLFTEMTEVHLVENLFEEIENDLRSQTNYYSLEMAKKDYPNMFSDKLDFISAITINPKLFLEAPVEILENVEYLELFLSVVDSYEVNIIKGIDYISLKSEDNVPDPYMDIMISDVVHKNLRAIPSVHEMALAYKDSLVFLRKKSTHQIFIKSYIYHKLICLTKNQFEDKAYLTKLQKQLPFFYSNIFFYHAFYNLKKRKFTAVDQIEKDTYAYMNDAYDLNLFDHFSPETMYDNEFMDNLSFAFKDTIINLGVFESEPVDFEEDIFKMDEQIKKYYS